MFTSVRFRLVLWNLLVFALAMAGLGLLLRAQLRANLERRLDAELAQRPRPRSVQNLPTRRSNHAPSERRSPDGAPPPPFFNLTGHNLFTNEIAPDLETLRTVARGSGPRFSTRWIALTDDGAAEPVRFYTVAIPGEDGKPAAVAQSMGRLTPVTQEVDNLTRNLLTLSPFALLVAVVGAAFLTDRALEPVREVTAAAAAIQAANLNRRLDVSGRDEFARLAETFNGMLARLDESFARQRRFIADASHELKTPLTVIKANTSLALADPDLPEESRETLTEIDRAADRTVRLVADLLLLARSDGLGLHLDRSPIPARELLDEACNECRRVHPLGPEVRITVGPAGLEILGDRHHLLRLLVNLLDNALRHTPAAGRVVLSASYSAGEVVLGVADTGVGISTEHLAHLGERFYRADPARARSHGGTGLGLAICRSIATAHNGTLEITSRPGQGTTVLVRLPG